VSAFVLGHLAIDAGIGFPIGLLIGCFAAVLVGTLAAVPALRMRGVSLVVITTAAAVALDSFWFTNTTWGGGTGGLTIPAPTLLGVNLGTSSQLPFGSRGVPGPVFGIMCVLAVVGLGLLVAALRRSSLGERMLAVRSNERAAATAGVNVARVKILGFAIAALIAGVAGSLYAYSISSVDESSFDIVTGLGFVAFAYVGGITTVAGAAFGGLLVSGGVFEYVFGNWLGIAPEYVFLLGGLGLIANVAMAPEGVVGLTARGLQRTRRQHSSVPLELAVEAATGGAPTPSSIGLRHRRSRC
jgi:branched-chain amino acid transport system permease protein